MTPLTAEQIGQYVDQGAYPTGMTAAQFRKRLGDAALLGLKGAEPIGRVRVTKGGTVSLRANPSAFGVLQASDGASLYLAVPHRAGQSFADGVEAAAQVVDECNRRGPYDAIGAASIIRALKEEP